MDQGKVQVREAGGHRSGKLLKFTSHLITLPTILAGYHSFACSLSFLFSSLRAIVITSIARREENKIYRQSYRHLLNATNAITRNPPQSLLTSRLLWQPVCLSCRAHPLFQLCSGMFTHRTSRCDYT